MENRVQHLAIIMDGNGRWAKKRNLPRLAGHRRGLHTVRNLINHAITQNIKYVTLFAFSSENWQRPLEEVQGLMWLFEKALKQELKHLTKYQVKLKVVGDITAFSENLQKLITDTEQKTAHFERLTVFIAANYGGRWDIEQAVKQMQEKNVDHFTPFLSFADVPPPDLLIRTGGEKRISNFLLWDIAYTELYFTDVLWPDFSEIELKHACDDFISRHRRFGGL
jgi:undecaprenyl diphosphate synthase